MDQPNITFTIIKSDAVKNNVHEQIIGAIISAGFFIVHRKENPVVNISMAQTVNFYYEHVGRPYFPDLMKSLIDGCVPLILEYPEKDESAVTKLRTLIGATNSRNAELDTIRGQFGGHLFNPEAPVAENAIHGSDSLVSALNEIKIIFPELTEIKSLVYRQFPLDQFQIGAAKLPEKIKVLLTEYEAFRFEYESAIFKNVKFGRAFYDRFKLYDSILKDNSSLSVLCNKDGDEAVALINTIVTFI